MAPEAPTGQSANPAEELRKRFQVSPEVFERASEYHRQLSAELTDRGVTLSPEQDTQLLFLLVKHEKGERKEGAVLSIPDVANALLDSPDYLSEKRGSIDQLLRGHYNRNKEAAAAMRERLAGLPRGAPAIVEFVSSDDRFYLAKLLTQFHLEEESGNMSHCIGRSTYYSSRMRKGEIEVFSLRDAKTHLPQITLVYSVRGKRITDMRLKSDHTVNAGAIPEAYKALVESLVYLRIGISTNEQGALRIRGLTGAASNSERFPLPPAKIQATPEQLREVVESTVRSQDSRMAATIISTFPLEPEMRTRLQALVQKGERAQEAYGTLRNEAPLLTETQRADLLRQVLTTKDPWVLFRTITNITHLSATEREPFLERLTSTADTTWALRLLREVEILPPEYRTKLLEKVLQEGNPRTAFLCFRDTPALTEEERSSLISVLEHTRDAWRAHEIRVQISNLSKSEKERLFAVMSTGRNAKMWVERSFTPEKIRNSFFSEEENMQMFEFLLNKLNSPYIVGVYIAANPEQRLRLIERILSRSNARQAANLLRSKADFPDNLPRNIPEEKIRPLLSLVLPRLSKVERHHVGKKFFEYYAQDIEALEAQGVQRDPDFKPR